MSKYPDVAAIFLAALLASGTPAQADGDPAKGEMVFKRCVACHAVGSNARNKLGPHLNDVLGRTAGSLPGYSFSTGMKAAGQNNVTWTETTLDSYLTNPRAFIKGTKMSFAGLPKESDRANVIAYLRTFSRTPASTDSAKTAPSSAAAPQESASTSTGPAAPAQLAATAPIPRHGIFHLGRVATRTEIEAWDIDVRPDGAGLPEGRGTVSQGEVVYTEHCASCHGDFGEGRDRWPVLAGGNDTLKAERPEKTIGSYWPFLSTVFDYVRRAMPFGDARSLTNDQVYAVTAYLLYLNNLVTDPEFELSSDNFSRIKLPNEGNFIPDNRAAEPQYANKSEPCMTNCKPEPAKVIMRARVLDVTPDSDLKNKPKGSVD